MSGRLQELEEEQQQIQEERALLSRQKEAMRAGAGPVEQQFLQETEKLMKEKLEIQCQAEKVHNKLQKQLKILEVDVEVKTSKLIEMEQERNAELVDLRQQNQVLGKQMEKLKRFIDEQAVDREHERDAFQLEIQKLEQQLKVVPRLQPVSEQQTREVEQLTGHLKEKTDKCSELLLCNEQLQRDVQERDDEIEKLECHVRELEQALTANSDAFAKINDQKHFGDIEAKSEISLEVQLQAERDAIERKEKEISNLEEQLEQFREELENKNEEVQELHMQLEIQKKGSTTHLQELQQENKLFKDEIKKLEFFLKDYDPQFCHDQPMLFGEFSRLIQGKDGRIDQLNEQLVKLQEQRETDKQAIKEKDELIKDLDAQIQCLMCEQGCVKKNGEEEIEQLKGVTENWQQELASIEQKTTEITFHPPDTESLQCTLDKVRAEEKTSEQKAETANEEMACTKRTPKEASCKMDQLAQELCILNKGHMVQEQLHSVPMESVAMAADELQADALQPEDVSAQDSSELLKTLTSVGCLKENTKGCRSLEIKLLGLESSLRKKDLELMQCHKQIKTMQEQGQSEPEMLQKKIKTLQSLLEEKVAAAIVSQAQLEAFQQYVKSFQEKRASEPERTDGPNVNPLTGDNLESDVYTLSVRTTELKNQVAEMHSSFISEKQHVEITEKKFSDTEKMLELQMPSEEGTKKRREVEEKERSLQDFDISEVSSIPGLVYSNAHQTREIRSSDSESDWGHGFDTASEGGEDGEGSAGAVPRAVKGLLRAVHTEGMQMLSLADSPEDDGEDQPEQKVSEYWLEERRTFISTILSLKNLISKMQVQRQTEVCGQSLSLESLPDWRGELLLALQDVLLKERSVLLAAFRTELMSPGTRDTDELLKCLQQRVQEQSIEYQAAMECLQKADRRSLLAENQLLHAQISGREVTVNREQETDTASQELLDCKMQQSCRLEVQGQHDGMTDRMAELQEQLSSERMVVSGLKNELSRIQLELETTLKAQHEHLKELEVFRLKANEVHLLSDTLARERKKSQELQCALAAEKAKSGHDEEQDKELKALRSTLEEQKQKNIHLDELLEQQRQLLNDLQQQIESQRMLYDTQLSEEQGRNLELQVLLESEKVRIQEMKDTLDKERELHSNGVQPRPGFPPGELFQELQDQLEEKQKRIIELVNETQKYKLDSLQVKHQMEKDRQVHQKTLQVEKEANSLGQQKMEELQRKVEELQRQLQESRQQVHKLDLEGERFHRLMQGFQQREQEWERTGKRQSGQLLCQNISEGSTWSFTDDRTRNWVLQQKMEGESKDTSYAKLLEMNREKDDSNNDVEIIRQKLQHVATKLQQHIAQKACDRLEVEVSDKDALIWVQERIDRIIFRVQRLRDRQEDEHSLVSSSSSCGSLIEMTLKQNSELTGHINQLTEEKNHLRNIIMQLEEQIKFYQQTRTGRSCSSRFSLDGGANIEDIIASEKEVWNKEKLALQKSLKRAEAKVCELKAELRNDALHQNQSPDSENAAFKKIYGKYLRAESFRKALVFQKKYLLLLLGRFQECEDATLGLLARMEGYSGFRDAEMVPGRTEGLTRFRTAIRVSIAITRMKYLVRRWHRVKNAGPININRDDFGLSPGVEKTDPLYHSTSGLELCEDPRHMTCRSRSDLDFPRSPLSFNRYPGTLADLNAASLTSPQLQHYNPGRTLTDYVTQMDALQRRLGSSSHSGSPALQFHTGMRR